jgi:hypothetical protein
VRISETDTSVELPREEGSWPEAFDVSDAWALVIDRHAGDWIAMNRRTANVMRGHDRDARVAGEWLVVDGDKGISMRRADGRTANVRGCDGRLLAAVRLQKSEVALHVGMRPKSEDDVGTTDTRVCLVREDGSTRKAVCLGSRTSDDPSGAFARCFPSLARCATSSRPLRSRRSGHRGAEQTTERRALQVARVRTRRRVTKAVPHLREPRDRRVEIVGLLREELAIDLRAAVGTEHARDLVEGQSRRGAHRDEREAFDDLRPEEATETSSSDRSDEPALFVVTKSRRRNAAALRNFADVH